MSRTAGDRNPPVYARSADGRTTPWSQRTNAAGTQIRVSDVIAALGGFLQARECLADDQLEAVVEETFGAPLDAEGEDHLLAAIRRDHYGKRREAAR